MINDAGELGARLREIRTAAGLSLSELARASHFSKPHLSNIETGRRTASLEVLMVYERVGLDRRTFLAGSTVTSLAIVSDIIRGGSTVSPPHHGVTATELSAVTDAFGSYGALGIDLESADALAPPDIDQLAVLVNGRYQGAEYAQAARMVPRLIRSADAVTLVPGKYGDREVYSAQARAYAVTAKLLTKVGDPHLAWMAADRAMGAALRSESPTLRATSAYQVACALLRTGRSSDAERVAVHASDAITEATPLGLSLRGSLTLLSAVMAGRRGDRGAAAERLAFASSLANELGTDANHGWTAFGPTNVQIHGVSIAVELGDASQAITRAASVKTDNLPSGLRSRRAQILIDGAWGYAHKRQTAEATMFLLQAEQVAPQSLRYNDVAADALRELLRWGRGDTAGLRMLAGRAGVAL